MINLSLSSIAWVFGGFETFKYVLIIFGFFSCILMKEVNYKNEYLFYYNNGISKGYLVFYSFIMNFVFSLLLILVINLILKLK
ncbi:hypothetical protein LNP27_03080 [Flavobacterium galactosidilyticum]|uniref:hypothetical protein n=1 Tax=Flavobacterium galactosidilyticum TaxID=2893886 RepID=UPI001E372298|nr:hypothetical protein [Flavobacterium sp. F-340]UFH47030.1 hypothetical protein LNP27_03080 [Flavobacterium sp. F-340]